MAHLRQPLKLAASVLACLLLLLVILHIYPAQLLLQHRDGRALLDNPSSQRPIPILAKLMLMVGEPNDIYERALNTHQRHATKHGYSMFVQRHPLVEGDTYWSKPAFVLSVLLRELGKPDEERLRWLMWVDYDTIVLNQKTPVEAFLPGPEWDEDLHFLVSNDFNGLNDGVFFIRVHTWSVDFMSALMAYRHFNPNTTLFWHEQSAMTNLLKEPCFSRHTLQLPWRWFNSYDVDALHNEPKNVQKEFSVYPGDLLVHLAGVQGREVAMSLWLNNVAERHDPTWEVDFGKTSYAGETTTFWEELRQRRIRYEAEV